MATILDYTVPFGEVKKIDAFGFMQQVALGNVSDVKHGKVILVTADTPLKASRGEGKTTTSIALVDALRNAGIDAAAVLRQPSAGITAAGSKGGASGGGKASLQKAQIVDWGLCGEMSAIESAQNLLVSFAEKAVDDGIIDTILVPRVSEMPSRSLRKITVDSGKNNVAERTVLTPASELMQIVVLSRSMEELEERIGNMLVGTCKGQPVRAKEICALWRIVNLLHTAVMPALTYTTNEDPSPVYVHAGPFGNVSLGIPSLISVEMACALHDVVVVEAGYGADAGAQKWLDIACRAYDAIWPSIAVLVTRATTWQDAPNLQWRFAFHANRLENFDIPTYPLVNLWEGEDDLREKLYQLAQKQELRRPIMGNLYRDGSDGLQGQLDEFIHVLCSAVPAPRPNTHKGMALMENIKWIAEQAYGVPNDRVMMKDGFVSVLTEQTALCERAGESIDNLAVLVVKSPATMTDDDTLPQDQRTVTVKNIELHLGAGLVQVNVTTSLTTPMPKIV